MSEFNRKNNHSFWHSPLILVVLFCVVILFAYNIFGIIEKERETSKRKELILSEIETLRNREQSLTKDINKLKTESGVEEIIRDKYQVVKESEKMVVIVDPEKKDESSAMPTSPEASSDHSFWGWIKKNFKL